MTDEHQIQVVIATPDGEVYRRNDATIVTLQTKAGQIGVMANHVPLLAALEISEFDVKCQNGQTDVLAINGGFVECSNNLLTVVADSAEVSGDIDLSRATSAKNRAQERINHAQQVNNRDDIARAQVALARAINRIKVASIGK